MDPLSISFKIILDKSPEIVYNTIQIQNTLYYIFSLLYKYFISAKARSLLKIYWAINPAIRITYRVCSEQQRSPR